MGILQRLSKPVLVRVGLITLLLVLAGGLFSHQLRAYDQAALLARCLELAPPPTICLDGRPARSWHLLEARVAGDGASARLLVGNALFSYTLSVVS